MVTFVTDTTVTSDQFPSSGTAYTYGANNLNLTIDPVVAVVSQDDNSVFSGLNGSRLANSGNIVSAASTLAAVQFSGNNGRIENNSTAAIAGIHGIRLDGSTEDVINYGRISGYAGFGVHFTTTSLAVSIYNIGEIYGRSAGVRAQSVGESYFENFGTVRSDSAGIDVTAGVMTILNEGSVITDGGSSIFTSGSASILLTNKGTLQGEVNCISASGNDFIINKGTITGTVGLGAGNDEFDGRGGSVSGDILGGTGNDIITGGKGGDELWGEGDSDIFRFVKVSEIGKGANRDAIMDFSDVEGDQIDLDDIDAKKGPGNQDFKFIGGQKFHHKAGELHVINKGGGVSIVEGDINGDGKADFQIQVQSNAPLEKVDFLL